MEGGSIPSNRLDGGGSAAAMGRSCCPGRREAAAGGSRGPDAEVLEDLSGDSWVLDEGDEAHGALTVGADQNVDGKGSLEQGGPVETARAARVGGTRRRLGRVDGGAA